MSKKPTNKLSSLKLTEEEKTAIAEMVATPGFRIWKDKIIPTREIQIALTNISMGVSENDLWYNKGMIRENSKTLKTLEALAAGVDLNEIDNDDEEADAEDE